MDLSAQLLQMIHNVSQSEDVRSAAMNLLHPLLMHLNMEQAVFCDVKEEVEPIFAMDRTKKILRPADLWISQTLIFEALQKMEPVVHIQRDDSEVSQSLHKFAICYAMALPVSTQPNQVVYIASRSLPAREPSAAELAALKITSRAAVLALQQQRNFHQLREQNRDLKEKLKTQERHFLHASPAIDKVIDQVKRIAKFNITVLLQGESGSGKEEIAQLVHQYSGRTGKFIAINCANLTETLLDSELFGHVKGAFTGAIHAKNGLLQEANEGTFFFDEIGELPLSLQAKLLRVLQERTIRPIGATKDQSIDVRFIAASHKNLWWLVQEKKFREDLYYRIQELVVHVPPLRERLDDVGLLANFFVRHFSQEFHLPERHLNPCAENKLRAYGWPGNVRELKNACRMAVILSSNKELTAADFRLQAEPIPQANASLYSSATKIPSVSANPAENGLDLVTKIHLDEKLCLRTLKEDLEKKVINLLLEQKGATQAHVAERLNISVRTLQRMLQ